MTGRRWGFVLPLSGLLLSATGCGGKAEASKSWSSFSQCLIGSPLSADENVLGRLRPIELELRKFVKDDAAWPHRCTKYGDKLFENVAGESYAKVLEVELGNMGCGKPGGCRFPTDGPMMPRGEELWGAAKQAALENVDVPDVPAPEGKAAFLDDKSWTPIVGGDARINSLRWTAAGDLWLLFQSKTAERSLCTFASSSNYAEATCEPVHSSIKRQVQFVQHDAEPLLGMLTEEGRSGFRIKDGTKVPVAGEAGNEVTDGFAIIQPETGVYKAVFVKEGKIQKEAALGAEPAGPPIVVGDHAVWLQKDRSELHLVPLSAKGRLAGKATRLPGPWNGSLETCEDTKSAVVVVRPPLTRGKVASKAKVRYARVDGDEWKVGELELPPGRRAEKLRCDGKDFSIGWATGEADDVQVGVSSTGAGGGKAEFKTRPPKSWFASAPVGDKLFLLWRDDLGAARMRLAPVADIATSEERVLFDSADSGGPPLTNLRVFTHGKSVLVVFGGEKNYALRFSDDGKIDALK